MISLRKIVSFLDKEFNINAFEDESHNGLQIEGGAAIRHICTGVDASMDFFEKAAERKADLLICHHGLSWGDSLKRITGHNYQRLCFLLKHGMALYACHLPLDAHPRMGNNAQICKTLGLRRIKPFGIYHGKKIGFCGLLSHVVSRNDFINQVNSVCGNMPRTMDFGKSRIRTVAVVSGGAGELVAEAGEAGIDAYVSGEPNLTAYHLAREYKINAIFAGHYATEVFGVKAVAAVLSKRFTVKSEFVDMKVPF